ncbi:hypothetical protein [Mesorhizobium muleiense]|uniref:hypothetical protein n=1 Tax=Mesorhizobium muleiense TaxID=1004279 RepID=UPI001F391A01|nr:hypothetical protein [Mesorhizobium muleiense]MCF6114135.1 hypothetical protein [Mesorhizobium muleiense]
MTFRGSMPLEDYPTRDTALSIIDALQRIEDGTHSELERLTGMADTVIVADRCYMVYGYPELEPAALARRMAEVYMRPRSKTQTAPPVATTAEPSTAPDHGYGFTPRR